MNDASYKLSASPWLVATAIFCTLMIANPVHADCNDRPAAAVDWTDCSKERLMLNENDMTAGIFVNTFLSGTGFNNARMAGANLQRSELVRSSFIGADLSGANFEKSLASRSDFSGANLRGARLVKAEFLRVSFVKADLTDADLSGGDFYRNDFTDAQMSGANLHDAIMPRTTFTGATMKGANLAGAFLLRTRFDNVDLSQVTGLEQTQLDQACGDAKTILPAGLTVPTQWPCSDE
ncbi:pentapeptide repeat-containing protein [Cypionkella sp.]|uniref:pentapeptide repeat-containing protein n=1 Tax=Cypionkella sp. TaxID=2811411 RepID=UPI002615A6B8|nr:pentapeptide repeat-containing protein [Cypionkella sp.]